MKRELDKYSNGEINYLNNKFNWKIMNKLLIIFLLLFRVDGLWAQLTDVSNPEKVYDCKKEQPVTIDYSDTCAGGSAKSNAAVWF